MEFSNGELALLLDATRRRIGRLEVKQCKSGYLTERRMSELTLLKPLFKRLQTEYKRRINYR